MPKKKTARKKKRTSTKPALATLAAIDYPQLLTALKERIQKARVHAHLAVNRELIRLYWDLGRMIVKRQEIDGWGKSVIERLSADLSAEFPEMKGLSLSNLWRMRSFFLAYSRLPEVLAQAARESGDASQTAEVLAQAARDSVASSILQQAATQFEQGNAPEVLSAVPWFHNVVLVEKLKDLELRLWYAAKAAELGWSRAVLVHQIESHLHKRAKSQNNNFALTLPAPQSDLARALIKDTFNLEFLDVRESLRERELEESLIANLRDFLLELGTGFAFVGNQQRLEIGGQDYFLDLLFYHTRLHCYVVVELKIDDFKPEYAGKMQFYLAAVDDLLKTAHDAPTIGILLCKERNKVVVEYALRDSSKPIAVAGYTLTTRLPKALKGELPSAGDLKRSLRKKK